MTPKDILAAFPNIKALVAGDICLDRWCTYDPSLAEPSRETGIARLGVVDTEVTPGAGGTVANNLASLGIGRVAVLGAIGTDGFGYELVDALNRRKIEPELLIRSEALSTFTYTKLINSQTGIEDQPRVDFLNAREIPGEIEQQVIDTLRRVSGEFDVIFIADQAETERGGVITAAVREAVSQLKNKVVLVDSRMRAALFRNVIIKPNQEEAGPGSYQRLLEAVGSRVLFVTQGPRGVLVVEPGKETLVPTRAVENPVDICGAGDSFAAGAGVALAITGSAVEAARFGNLVASVTIMKKGTGAAAPDEVLHVHAGH
ncbi:MAG: bifunctional heptose 7-phosphate kinase/heptose 1-phosphate adenyltransferase [Bryobacteraceae bacterium]